MSQCSIPDPQCGEPSATVQCGIWGRPAPPASAMLWPGPHATMWHVGPSPGTGGSSSSLSPQGVTSDIPSHPSLPAHPRHLSASPDG